MSAAPMTSAAAIAQPSAVPVFIGDAEGLDRRDDGGDDGSGLMIASFVILGLVALLVVILAVRRAQEAKDKRDDDVQGDLDEIRKDVDELAKDAAAAAGGGGGAPKPRPSGGGSMMGAQRESRGASAVQRSLKNRIESWDSSFSAPSAPMRSGKTATNDWTSQVMPHPGVAGGSVVPDALHRVGDRVSER